MADIKFLKRVQYSDINTLDDDDSAFFYEAGMTAESRRKTRLRLFGFQYIIF